MGIRFGKLEDSTTISKNLGHTRSVVCGSPAYFKQAGIPSTPNDLADHQCILSTKGGVPSPWKLRQKNKEFEFIPANARLTLNSIDGIIESARQGIGLVNLYSYQVAAQVANGDLDIVLNKYEIDPIPVNIVYPQRSLTPIKLRAFIDFASPRIRELLKVVEKQCFGI